MLISGQLQPQGRRLPVPSHRQVSNTRGQLIFYVKIKIQMKRLSREREGRKLYINGVKCLKSQLFGLLTLKTFAGRNTL